jgi:hypothetical protein
LAVHQNGAALAAVVVVDIHDAERRARVAERERNSVANAHVMLIREGLADQHGVRSANLREDLLVGPAGEKVRAAFRAQRAEIHGR